MKRSLSAVLLALATVGTGGAPCVAGMGASSIVRTPSEQPLQLAWCARMGGYATMEAFERAKASERQRMRAEVTQDQIALQSAGYYRGRIDGVSGSGTRAAIADFRRANGFTPGTTLDVQSRQVLTSTDVKKKEGSGASRREVQQMLADLGYYKGEVDGITGPQTRAALARFRQDRGLPPGPRDSLDSQGLAALQDAHSKVR